jgi:NAD(P)-dependent dehydrogenase (short-subunit alcohol dehydrogenase family)
MSPSPQEAFFNGSILTKRRDTYPFIDPYRFRGALAGQIVLITNAHRGIGRASALDFASCGATVVCTARTVELLQPLISEIKTRYNTPSHGIPVDLNDPTIPPRLIQYIEQTIGPISTLLNVTLGQTLNSFPHISNFLADWWACLEANLRTPIALIHAVLPHMLARSSGTIISTTFRSGAKHIPFTTSSSVTHSAIIRFHHGLNDEILPKGIYSYVVHPGIIASHLHDPEAKVDSSHFALEPRIQSEMTSRIEEAMQDGWCGAGLASGTFLALVAEPRAKCLSGLYVDAERDLEEMIVEVEKGAEGRVQREGLYVLKVDEL